MLENTSFRSHGCIFTIFCVLWCSFFCVSWFFLFFKRIDIVFICCTNNGIVICITCLFALVQTHFVPTRSYIILNFFARCVFSISSNSSVHKIWRKKNKIHKLTLNGSHKLNKKQKIIYKNKLWIEKREHQSDMVKIKTHKIQLCPFRLAFIYLSFFALLPQFFSFATSK